MLRNQEKNSVFRGIFLIGSWSLYLERSTKEIKKVVFFLSMVGVLHFLALYFLNVKVMKMLRV